MTSTQQQDLSIYKDNTILSDVILDSDNSYNTLISYVEGTQPTWLVNCIIETSLLGTSTLVNKDLNKKIPNRSEVYVVSFTNPREFYVKSLKKNGLDLIRENNFKYIDCFTELFTKYITNPADSKSNIGKMFDNIYEQIKSSSNTKKVIILENPEILVFSTNITSIELFHHIMNLNRLCRNLYIITSHNYPQQVDLASDNSSTPTYKNTDFLTKLHHGSNLDIYIEPLTTGRADDITGILSISKGPKPYEESKISINEKSYIYNISKESNIKLYFR